MLNESEAVVNGVNKWYPKIYLYSGHDFNVALVLLALDAFPPEVPNYGSYVAIELHLVNDVFGYKVSSFFLPVCYAYKF